MAQTVTVPEIPFDANPGFLKYSADMNRTDANEHGSEQPLMFIRAKRYRGGCLHSARSTPAC